MAEAVTASAIDKVRELAERAVRPFVLPVPGENDSFVHVVNGKGEREVVALVAPDANFAIRTANDLLDFILENAGTTEEHFLRDRSAIFVGVDRIEAMSDRLDARRGSASVSLTFSGAMKTLRATVSKFGQRDFIRFLRINFDKCLPDTGLLRRIRDLKFLGTGATASILQHGQESMGKWIDNAVQGDLIPEEITLNVQVFEESPKRATVRCAIEIYPDVQQFSLIPFPEEIFNATQAVLSQIASQLSGNEGGLPVFIGQPL